jgi:hypothetical protein
MNNIAPQAQFPVMPSGPDLELIKLAGRIRSGSGWIIAIAALSAVNSIITAFGGELSFVVGMGITQMIDAFGVVFAEEIPEFATIIQVIVICLSLGVTGVLGIFAFFARRGHVWAFILSALGYFVDTLIILYFQDFYSLLFHVVALFFITNGTLAALKFRK